MVRGSTVISAADRKVEPDSNVRTHVAADSTGDQGSSDFGTVLWRLNNQDKLFAEITASVADLRRHVDERLDRLGTSITTLQFVSKEVFETRMTAITDYNKESREIATSSRSLAMWALGILATLILGAAITIAVRLATA